MSLAMRRVVGAGAGALALDSVLVLDLEGWRAVCFGVIFAALDAGWTEFRRNFWGGRDTTRSDMEWWGRGTSFPLNER
jgi:hypothetical protein